MAGKIVTNEIQLGDHATPANNFVLKTNADGTASLKRNADGSGGDILTVDATGKVTLNANLSNRFTSAEQTITASGTLTIAHGLGGVPFHVSYLLKCNTAEGGYSIGDLLVYNHAPTSSSSADTNGFSSTVDSTNITIRFSSSATTLLFNNKTTGGLFATTNANWKLIVKAEA